MSYLTDADIESVLSDARLAEFTAESGTVADAGVTELVRTDVDDVIDSALAGRYAVPVTSTTDRRTLRPHAKILFKWSCLVRRNLSPDEATRIAYEATDRYLRGLQKAEVHLSPAAAPAPIPTTPTDSTTGGTASIGSALPVASGLAGYL